jgi:serine/threonine protein kinase
MNKRKFQALGTVELKGYGGFGCVGAPATNCNPYFPITVLKSDGSVEDIEPIDKKIDITDNPEYTTKTLPNKVFKIMLAKDAKPEFEKSKYLLLQGNDLSRYGILECTMGIYNNYHESFTTMKELCPSAFRSKPDEYRPNLVELTMAWDNTTFRNNDIDPDKPLTLMMIIYEDGGISLDDYRVTLYNYIRDFTNDPEKLVPDGLNKFFRSLKNLFEGLKTFRSNNIMHGDIKVENIVYDETSGVARFIDFGSATSKEKLLAAAARKAIPKQPVSLEPEIRANYPYAHVREGVPEIKTLFAYVSRNEPLTKIEPLVESIIAYSDLFFLCKDLITYIYDYYGHMPFITKLYTILTETFHTYRDPTSLQTLITKYDALLATLPVYDSTSGGYNKKNNQKKRKTNKRKTNKRKTNKRKTNKRKTNKRKTKRKTNKRKTNKRKTNKRKINKK